MDTLGSRVLEQSPVGDVEDMRLVLLGAIEEVELSGRILRWVPRKSPLAWSKPKKTLFILEGARKGRRGGISPATPQGVVAGFEDYAGRDATYERTDTMPTLTGWRSFGSVRRIDYYSDKQNKKQEYTHKSGHSVRLYRLGGAKPPWLWAIKGGRMSVNYRGILN